MPKPAKKLEQSTPAPTIIEVAIAGLKPHPEQGVFNDVSITEQLILRGNLLQHGQREPIEILPCGTILGGNQLVDAAKSLGWKKLKAVVRDDLVAAGKVAQLEHLVRAHLERRLLDSSARARAVQLLCRLKFGDQPHEHEDHLRHELEKQFGPNKREVDWILSLLKLPQQLQTAISKGQLSSTTAIALVSAPPVKQQEVMQLISEGESVVCSVDQVLAKTGPSSSQPHDRFLAALRRVQQTARGLELSPALIDEPHQSLVAAVQSVLAQLTAPSRKSCKRKASRSKKATHAE